MRENISLPAAVTEEFELHIYLNRYRTGLHSVLTISRNLEGVRMKKQNKQTNNPSCY